MDNVRPRASYSPIKRSYYSKLAFRPKNLKQDVKTSRVKNMTTARIKAVVNTGKGKMDNALKKSRWVWRPKGNYMDHESKEKGSFILKNFEYGNLESILQDHAVVGSGCSNHMTGNKAYLSDYKDYNGGFVAFGSDPKGGKIRTANLDFDDVYFVDELKFNLFSVLQMFDKKNSVLFTDTECLILSPSFKLLDESQVVLRAPRQNDVYSLDLKNIVPSGGITYLYANATSDESKLWHRRLGHVNFKNINKLVKGHLVRGLPSKVFVNDHTCVACKKGKQHKASCKPPSISFMRPFGCPLTILNTLDPLGKFDRKSDEGYLLGYSTSSKAFRVYNKRVKERLHIDFLKDQPNVAGNGIQESYVAVKDVVLDAKEKPSENATKDNDVQDSEDAFEEEKKNIASTKRAAQATSINKLNTGRQSVGTANTPYVSAASTPIGANTGESSFVYLGGQIPIDASTLPNADLPTDPNMPDLENDSDIFSNEGIFSGVYDDEDKGAEADFNNIDNTIDASPIPTLIIHKDHPKGQILRDPKLAVQTRGKIQKASSTQQALGKRQLAQTGSLGIRWMREVLLIEAIGLFLAFASYMGFPVYQMDVKSAFIYGTIEEEVYVHQPPGFVDPAHPPKVYKVVKALYGLHRACSTKQSMYTEFEDCMHKRFQMSSMGELTFFLGLQVKQQPDGIFISQYKYVVDILKKFDFLSIRTATTPVESNKPLVKDEDGIDIDVHVYRSMIGSLMYLTASRPYIMFVVCACARHQVHPKASHLNAVKRIFRYLKHQPKLGLWYPRDLPFELEAFSDSYYRGSNLDRISTTGGCQFLSRRLISWNCKKQTIAANSTIEAEYVAAANCCRQVLWIQNQMMDYGFNFMNTNVTSENFRIFE
ncbi:putative ribonuclease H-like domain-containing protein [Tanacetum coccineum]